MTPAEFDAQRQAEEMDALRWQYRAILADPSSTPAPPEAPISGQAKQAADAAIARAAERVPDADRASAKRFTTVQAQLALIGHELVALPGGGYVVARWGQVRALADLAEVEAFLRMVGGKP